jgi:CrcB protein
MTRRLPPAGNLAFVAAGGAVGATTRVAFATWFPVADGAYPWTTFLENVFGAFALAFALSLFAERLAVRPAVRLLVCTGALGAFTTYSTLALELDRLVAGGHLATAVAYAVASSLAGLVAALVGLRLGRGRPAPARVRPPRGGRS